MTLKERMMHCYRNEYCEEPVAGIYTRYLKRGNMERLARNQGLGIIDYVALTTQIGPPWHLKNEFLSEIKNTSVSIEYYWEKGIRKHRRKYITPVGTVYAEVSEDAGDGSEAISHYYIATLEDYTTMKYIVENTVICRNEELFLSRQKDLGEDGVVIGRVDRSPYQKLMLELVGGENFLVDLYSDPEPVEELIEILYKRLDEEMDMAMDSRAEIIWMPENITCDMTPPNSFRKYHLKAFQKYTAWAHQAGKIVVTHLDGKIKHLADALKESGIDGLESVSDPQIGGDMTYRDLCVTFPDKAVLPNFPANIATDTEGKIESFIGGLRETAKELRRPLMVQVSEDLPENTYHTAIPRIVKALCG